MIIFIILAVVFIIIMFVRDNNKDQVKVVSQGGIKTKYKYLIEQILASSHSHTITELSERTAVIGGYYGDYKMIYCSYRLEYHFGKLKIKWEFNSEYYGNRTESFVFDEGYNQDLILKELDLKIENVTKQIIQKTF